MHGDLTPIREQRSTPSISMQTKNLLRNSLLAFSVFFASGTACISASDPDLVGVLASITEPGNASELGLTQDQLDRLNLLIKQHESQALTFSSQIRQLPSAEQRAKKSESIRSVEKQGFALLTEAQQSTAEKWRLQKLGPTALLEPQVAILVGVTEEQIAKIKNILEGKSILNREMGRIKATAELNARILAILDESQRAGWQALVGKPSQSDTKVENAVLSENAVSPESGVSQNALLTSDVAVKVKPKMIGPEDGLSINFNAAPWSEVLKWLAKEAELSLQGDAYPTGTFTYRDPYRRYSVAETMDIMNGVLLGKGYTLVKKQRILISVDLGSGESADVIRLLVRELAELVAPEDLNKRGDYEIVKCVFTLERSTVEEIEKEVKLLIGPQGSVVPLPTAGQVLVCETGGKLRIIRDLIERSEKPNGARSAKIVTLPLKYVSADEVLGIARPLLGLKDGLNTSDVFSMSTDTFGNTIYATGTADKLQILRDITTEIDVKPSDEATKATVAEPPYFKTHRLLGSDPSTTMDVLQSTFSGQTNMKLSIDPKTNNILAFATKEDHEKIEAIIAELAGQNSDFEVIQLTKLDTQAAILTLEKFFGKQSKDAATAKGPIFYGDAASKRIMVKGTKEEVAQIRTLLTTVEASSPEAESLMDGLILLPFKGKSADRMLEQIQLLMDARKSKSRFRMVLPPGESKINNGEKAADEPVPAPKNPTDGRSALYGRPTNPFSKFVTVAQESESPQQTKSVAAAATAQSKAGLFDEIVIRRGPNGLIITSENPDALREFNQLYKLAQEQLANAPAEPAVIILKHIKAAAAAELIKSIIAGEAATGGGGGGGLLGDVASSVLGGGGIFGSLFGGGGGGGSGASTSSAITGDAATGNVVITPDPRLNALWVQANGSDMQMVEDLILMIDIPDSGIVNLTRGTPETIFINNVPVADIEAIVKQVFADRIAAAPGAGAQRQPSPQEILQLIGGGGGGRRGGGGGGAAQSELKEQTMTVSSDKKNNALIVVAPPMLFQDVKKLVEELDQASEDDDPSFIVVPMPAEVNATTMQNALKSAFGASVKTSTASGTNATQGATGAAGNPADFLQQFRNRAGGGGAQGGGGGFGAGGFPGGFGGGGFGGAQGGGGQRGGNTGGFGGGGNQGGGGGGNQGGGQRGGGGTQGGGRGGR